MTVRRSVALELDAIVGRLARLEDRIREAMEDDDAPAFRADLLDELDTIGAAIIVQARRLERRAG